MTAFISCFTEDATVFFPVPEPPQRFAGKTAIQAHFEQVFATIRKTSTSLRPPYHRLRPEDLLVHCPSPDAAVSFFHLPPNQRTAPRALLKMGGIYLLSISMHLTFRLDHPIKLNKRAACAFPSATENICLSQESL